jgi:CHC2-type zinc finger protein
MNSDIKEAKSRLDLPRLMTELGYGDRAKKSARCPFHSPDRNPSFSVFEKDGQWFWQCHAGCGGGDEIDFLAKLKFGGDVKQALPEYLRKAGVTSETRAPKASKQAPAIQPRPLGELLDAVAGILRRYVVFPLQEQASVIAVWCSHLGIQCLRIYALPIRIQRGETVGQKQGAGSCRATCKERGASAKRKRSVADS